MRSITAWIVLLAAPLAWGNGTHLVRSTHSTEHPFEIVFEDGTKETTEKPGVYAVSAKGVRLAIAGNVLGASKRSSGVIENFYISAHTNRNESIAVIDGKLVIFGSKTTNDPASKIVIGSKQNPLFDILSQALVTLGDITEPDAVVCYGDESISGAGSKRGQLVICSVRQRHALGSGFTFAFVLKYPESGAGTKLQTLGNITVLDYDFTPKQKLSSLIEGNKDFAVFSRSLLKSHQKKNSADHPLITEWRGLLRKFDTFYTNTKSKGRQELFEKRVNEIPMYNLLDGTVTLLKNPNSIISEKPVGVQQSIDPFSGRAEFVLGDAAEWDIDKNTIRFPGQIDVDKHGDALVYAPDIKRDSEDALESHVPALLVISGRLHAAIPEDRDSQDNYYLVDLGVNVPADGKGFSSTYRDDGKHYFFVSSFDSGVTEVLVVEKVGKTGRLVKRLPLMKKALYQAELNNRIHVGKDMILFDNVTPPTRGSRYTANAKRTTPYLNVVESTEANPQQFYLQSKVSKRLTQQVAYMEFNPKGALKPHTGLYVEVGKETELVPGVLLRRGKKAYLDQVSIMPEKGSFQNPEVKVAFFALGDEKNKDAKSFDIAAVFSTNEGSTFVPAIHRISIPMPFSQFRGAKAIVGRRKHHNKVSLVCFFDADKSRSRGAEKSGGVYSVEMQLEFNFQANPRQLVITPTESEAHWLQRSPVPLATLKSRVVPDNEGQWYWIVDPEVERKSSQYSIRELGTPAERIFPNRASTRRTLKFDEEIGKDWGENFQLSNWLMYGTTAIASRFDWFETELRKLDEKETKNGEPLQSPYPDLDTYLDTLTSAAGGTGIDVLLVD
ncbi:hypothetical protein K2X33_12070, partial [bacterium]|nr:hypothetical protein [bacterium]